MVIWREEDALEGKWTLGKFLVSGFEILVGWGLKFMN